MKNNEVIHFIYLSTEIITLIIAVSVFAWYKFKHKKISYSKYSFYLLIGVMVALLTHIIYFDLTQENCFKNVVNEVLKEKKEINYVTKTEEIFQELGKDIVAAKSNVYIMSWEQFGEKRVGDKTLAFFKQLNKVAEVKDNNIMIRRILWKKTHLLAIKRDIDEYNSCQSLELYYYKITGNEIPIMPSVSIDHKIVHMGNGYLNLNTENVDFKITNEEFASSFEDYFNRITDQATQIKRQFNPIDTVILNELLSKIH